MLPGGSVTWATEAKGTTTGHKIWQGVNAENIKRFSYIKITKDQHDLLLPSACLKMGPLIHLWVFPLMNTLADWAVISSSPVYSYRKYKHQSCVSIKNDSLVLPPGHTKTLLPSTHIPPKIQYLLKSQFMIFLACMLSYKHLNLCLWLQCRALIWTGTWGNFILLPPKPSLSSFDHKRHFAHQTEAEACIFQHILSSA